MTLETLLALGEVALCGFAIRRRQHGPERAQFPLIPGLLIAHLLLFGLPAALFCDELVGTGAFAENAWSIVVPEMLAPESLHKAALTVFAGMLALVLGYELPLARMLMAPIPAVHARWRRDPAPRALLLLALGLAAAALEKAEHGPVAEGILAMVSFLGLWAMGTLWLLERRGLLRGSARVATWAGTAALVGLEVIQGALWRPLIDGALLYAVCIRARGRIPLLALALCAPLFLALASAKIVFRTLLPQERWRSTSAAEKGRLYAQSLRLALDDPAALELAPTLLSRMSDIALLAVVAERSPLFVPYWNGATYAALGWSFVPRLIAPDKPKETTGQDFPHRYAIIAPEDDRSSTNLAALIELYANFGPLGAVLGMMLFGAACRGLERLFIEARSHDAVYALAAPVMASLLFIEQPFRGAFGAFVQHTPCLIVALQLSGICAISFGPILPRRHRGRPLQALEPVIGART